jgi:predicted nucleic acid-binding protein
VKLKDIADGTKVFIDANIFLFLALNDPRFAASCVAFLQRVTKGEVQGFTSLLVLNEVLHKLMVTEIARKRNWTQPQASQYLNNKPQAAKQLIHTWRAIDLIKSIPNLTVLDVSASLFWKGIAHSKSIGLLAMDGAHIAVMEAHGLTHLASNDSDFRRVPWLKVYWP